MSNLIKSGVTRNVICVGNIVIKFPRAHHGIRYFVMGMLGNILEYEHWNLHKHPRLAPVYDCGPLGLWLVMKRYKHILNRQLTDSERKLFPFIDIDDNGANIADEDGVLILFDYGNPSLFYCGD